MAFTVRTKPGCHSATKQAWKQVRHGNKSGMETSQAWKQVRHGNKKP